MKLLMVSAFLVLGYSLACLLTSLLITHGDVEVEPTWAASLTLSGDNHHHEVRAPVLPQLQRSVNEHSRFFPSYGSKEFNETRGWVSSTKAGSSSSDFNCTFLARPNPQGNEGISDWIAQIVSGQLLAQQKGCRLLLDYGPNVDIHQVLEPLASSGINWTVPSGFDCSSSKLCFLTQSSYRKLLPFQRLEKSLGHLARIPSYRFAYHGAVTFHLNATDFREIQQTLVGFELTRGMACALSPLLQLAHPSAAKYQPDLFTKILPTLHQPHTLVMALYMRTAFTDFVAIKEKQGEAAPDEDVAAAERHARKIMKCALELEQEYVSNSKSSKRYDRVVWMVVTDSPHLKEWIHEESRNIGNANSTTITDNANAILPLPREVITTRSRGIHTRPGRGPSTADFAEAFIDWYLIGESDLVIKDNNGPSFAGTAALRNARPMYTVPFKGNETCTKMKLVY